MNDIDRLNQKLEDMKLELKCQKEALCEVLDKFKKELAENRNDYTDYNKLHKEVTAMSKALSTLEKDCKTYFKNYSENKYIITDNFEDLNKRIAVLEDRLSPMEDLTVEVREVRHTYKFINLEMHTHSKLSPFVSICYLDENGKPCQKFYASYDFNTLNDFLKNFFLTPDHIAD